jgi:hypothetical protein
VYLDLFQFGFYSWQTLYPSPNFLSLFRPIRLKLLLYLWNICQDLIFGEMIWMIILFRFFPQMLRFLDMSFFGLQCTINFTGHIHLPLIFQHSIVILWFFKLCLVSFYSNLFISFLLSSTSLSSHPRRRSNALWNGSGTMFSWYFEDSLVCFIHNLYSKIFVLFIHHLPLRIAENNLQEHT